MSKATFSKKFQKGPDRNGETTYIMYHGTTMKAVQKIKRNGFVPSADGMLGPGVYVSRSYRKAACYPKGAKGQKRAVLKLSVRVGRVKKIDKQGHHLQKSWHQAGYDTAWVPSNCGMVKSGRQENCVWDPKRIRVLSILNSERESSDDESTDEEATDAYDDSSIDEDGDGDEDDDDDDVTSAKRMGGEESTDSSDETSSRHSSDTSTDEDVNTDDTSSDHDDDTYSGHSDDDDEASDEEGSNSDEHSDVFRQNDASEYSVEYSDKDSYESDDDY